MDITCVRILKPLQSKNTAKEPIYQAGADDEKLALVLLGYHREGKTSNAEIAKLLEHEHGITMSDTTVKRRCKALGLSGSGATIKTISPDVAEQLVLREMEKDLTKSSGVRTIKNNIAYNYSIHLPRDYVRNVMHTHEPETFAKRAPSAKKIHREKKYPIGIHQRWSADGHDKLYRIGFPIWALADDATSKWLGAWVVPSNRTGAIVAYLVLETIIKFRGLPLQLTTDCGSETTIIYGIMNELRERYYPNLERDELPPHVYLRSVHNIVIERSWLRLRLELGDNAVAAFEKGVNDGIYQQENESHFELCRWLWSKLLQQELTSFVDRRNAARMRKNTEKPGPSGMSRNDVFRMPQLWGGRDCLLPISEDQINVLRETQEMLGGAELLSFCTTDYAACAQAVYDGLNITELSFANVWFIFEAMLPALQVDLDTE
ncbi:hypothetical protein H0H92_003824 [Tricholoma furcatifolium]|nr:hypothetical protein H0H92_003824 [Tricholoma furcatifolium]